MVYTEEKLKRLWKVDELKFIAKFDRPIDRKTNRFKGDYGFFIQLQQFDKPFPIKFPKGLETESKNGQVSLYLYKPSEANINHDEYYQLTLKVEEGLADIKNPLGLTIKEIDILDQASVENHFKEISQQKEKRKFVDNLRKEYEITPDTPLQGLVGSVKRLTAETNKKPETFIFELIQNADDYPKDTKSSVQVNFTITHDHLVLTHNGLSFTEKNVWAISTVDAGDKGGEINKTGFKGIGFKSIFKFSNLVWINSGGYSFKFDQNKCERDYERKMPWQLIPFWNQPKNLDEQAKKLASEPVSIFIKPSAKSNIELQNKLHEIYNIFNSVFKDSRVLLFLRHVNALSVTSRWGVHKIKIENSEWVKSTLDVGRVTVPNKTKEKLNESILKDERIPAKYKDINSTIITFAASVKDKKILKTHNSRLYAYLPTDLNFGFGFLLNGDFIPDGSRDKLFDDIDWNKYLMKQAGILFVKWLAELSNSFDENSVFDLVPNLSLLIRNENDRSKKKFLELFKEGFNEGVRTIPFLKTKINDFKTLSFLRFDETNVSSILGSNELQLLFGSESNLLHQTIAKNQVIKKLFKEFSPNNIFHWEELKDKIGMLNSWLGVIENNISFLNLLSASKETELFSKSKIALNKEGQLSTLDYLWINVPNNLIDSIPELGKFCLNDEVYEKLIKAEDSPFKSYNSNEFFNQVISNDELLSKLDDFTFSIKFFDALTAYYEDFSSQLIDKIKALPFYDINQNQVTSIGESNFYFPNKILIGLMESLCFPDNHISLLASEYLNLEEEQPLWVNLGCKEFKDETAADFIKGEVCNKIDVINAHLIELFNRDTGSYFSATSALLKFYFSNKDEYSEKERKDISSKLGKLLICNSENELKALSESFIPSHYSGKDSIESLLDNFPSASLSFISNEFSKYGNLSNESLAKIFEELGANIDETSFIRESLIPILNELNKENIVAATRLLFQHQDILDSNINQVGNFPALTKEGVLVDIKQANYGSDYLEDGEVKNILSKVQFENELCSDYIKADGEQENLLNFFFKRGLKNYSENELIGKAISNFTNETPLLNEEVHFSVFSSLLQLFSEEKLNIRNLFQIKAIQLKCFSNKNDSESWRKGSDILFSSQYTPKIEFQKYDIKEEVFFLSNCYFKRFSKSEDLKKFLLKLGVLDDFICSIKSEIEIRFLKDENYRVYINNIRSKIFEKRNFNGDEYYVRDFIEIFSISLIYQQDLNRIFWEKISENTNFKEKVFGNVHYHHYSTSIEVPNYPTWYIKTNKTVPNLLGELCFPNKLYANDLKDLINDDSKISNIDFKSISGAGLNIDNLLGLKIELDLNAIIEILRRENSHNWLKEHGVFTSLDKLLKNKLTEEEKSQLSRFSDSGKLLNQKLEWVGLKDLFYLESGFKLGASKSSNLLHLDFEKLGEVLGLIKLSEADFELDCPSKSLDFRFHRILKDRSRFFAFLMDNKNWNTLSDELTNEMNKFKFYSCSSIALSYPKLREISNNDYEFLSFEDKDEYYYLGKWDGFRTADLFPNLVKRLKLKSPVNTKVFKDILISSEQDCIKYLEDKGHVVPKEWNPKESIHQEELITSEVEQEENQEYSEPPTPDIETSEVKSSLDEEYNKVHEEKITGEGDLTEEEQIETYEDNIMEGLNFLKNEGYDVANSEDDYGIHRNILTPQRDSVNFIIKSAPGGLLHIAKRFWEELANENCFILVRFPGGNYKVFKTRGDIISNELNVNLLFRVENENDVNQVDHIFDSLIDSKSQLLVVTDKKMLLTLREQFERQKSNPITKSANSKTLDY